MTNTGDLEIRLPDRLQLANSLAVTMKFMAGLCWLGVLAALGIVTTGALVLLKMLDNLQPQVRSSRC